MNRHRIYGRHHRQQCDNQKAPNKQSEAQQKRVYLFVSVYQSMPYIGYVDTSDFRNSVALAVLGQLAPQAGLLTGLAFSLLGLSRLDGLALHAANRIQ
jgi:hypothetical protein